MLQNFFKWQFLQEYNYLRTEKSGEGIIKNGGKAEKERKKHIFSTGKSNRDVKAAEDVFIWPLQ